MEYGGAKRTIWSLFGAQFGEEFGEVLLLRLNFGRTAFGAPDPTALETWSWTERLFALQRTSDRVEFLRATC
jgi:hypothetical protein